uniref:MepB family protein n=1 Tax=Flavobacterium sp. TaxID=239 RepID=UPI004049B35A
MTNMESFLLENKLFSNVFFEIKNITFHDESKEYGSASFLLNGQKISYRKAKITPKKVGQFVTFWKRTSNGIITPFDSQDNFDFLVIKCAFENKEGQFIFPKSILLQKGIVSSNTKDGKRAFRVYPIWEKPTSKQALKTQLWQKEYFVELSDTLDFNKYKNRYFK